MNENGFDEEVSKLEAKQGKRPFFLPLLTSCRVGWERAAARVLPPSGSGTLGSGGLNWLQGSPWKRCRQEPAGGKGVCPGMG